MRRAHIRKRTAAQPEDEQQDTLIVRSDKKNNTKDREKPELDFDYEASGSAALKAESFAAAQSEYHSAENSSKSSRNPRGPIRLPTNLRSTCRFDYAPDLCKDYNETGFCGFGDSCKFFHDRGDYKSGWELDLEWERKKGHVEQAEDLYTVEEDQEVEAIDNSCGICGKELSLPTIVKSKCGHLFCESCALKHSRSDKTCPRCKTEINGQFQIVKTKT